MSSILVFKTGRVEKALLVKLDAAVNELSQLTGEQFHLAEAVFGKLLVIRLHALVIAMVSTHSRPSRQSIVAIDELGIVYLPGVRVEDINELKNRLSLSPSDSDRLEKICRGDPDDLR